MPWRALTPEAGDIISVHSGETLDNLMSAGGAAWRHTPILVPGERVAQRAIEVGFQQVIVAENATDDAMLQALVQWRQRRADI